MPIIPPITDSRGQHWSQPDRGSIVIDDTHAIMSEASFKLLFEGPQTIPIGGAYPGKMWKARASSGVWHLYWYGKVEGYPTACTGNSRIILVA